MIGFSAKAKATCVAGAICAFFFAAFASPLAIEQDFPDDNCAITFPAGWHVMSNYPPRPGVIAAYTDTTRNRIVLLVIYNKRPAGPLNDRLIAGFEQRIQSDGQDIISGKYTEVGGIKSYEQLGSMDSHGKHISTINLLVPGENQYVIVVAMRFDGDASVDPEIQQVVGSFRFMHPFVPSYSPNSVAYRLGQLTGYVIVTLVVVAIVVFAVRSNRTPSHPSPRPPSRPPPLPPGIC